MGRGSAFEYWAFTVGLLTVAASVALAGESNQAGDPPAEKPVPEKFIVYLVTETNPPWHFRMAPPRDYQTGIAATWIEVFVPEYGVAYRLGQDALLKVEPKRYEEVWKDGRYGKEISYSRLEWFTLTEKGATEILQKCRTAKDKETTQPAVPANQNKPRPRD